MSLDVYLTIKGATSTRGGSGIWIRESGSTREISREEWNLRFPGSDPVVAMREDESECVYSANITHNLGDMADAAGIYKACWRPEEIGITHASQLTPLLREGLAKLEAEPEKFRAYNASNGWGLYENFVPWVRRYLEACEKYPAAEVSVSR